MPAPLASCLCPCNHIHTIRYEGEFFKGLFNGHGLYTVPPITRDERLRAYKMRMLFAAEQQLLKADEYLDLGEADNARIPLQRAVESFEQAGLLDQPPPEMVEQLLKQLDAGVCVCVRARARSFVNVYNCMPSCAAWCIRMTYARIQMNQQFCTHACGYHDDCTLALAY